MLIFELKKDVRQEFNHQNEKSMGTRLFSEEVIDYKEVFAQRGSDQPSLAQKVADNYYTIVTEFYEKGWGESFHFGPRFKGENFKASLVRHEYFLALKLGLSPRDKVLDIGCGIMGPARNIARLSGAHITGLTINQHQVERCLSLNRASSVNHLLRVEQGDFMDMPFPDSSFDKMYAIEATCHAPDLAGVYRQVLNKLKPGGRACFYEWAMTDRYDRENAEHRKIKEMIEYGNGIYNLLTIAEIDKAIEAAGLIREETLDLAHADYGNDVPWYHTLHSGWSFSQMRHTKLVRTVLQASLDTLEFLHLVPQGTAGAHRILITAANGLSAGGEAGIFTPMYMVVVRKA